MQLFRALLVEGAGLSALLTSSRTVASPALRALYGDDIIADEGDVFELDPTRRAGVLTLPGVMAAHAHAEALRKRRGRPRCVRSTRSPCLGNIPSFSPAGRGQLVHKYK